MRSFRNQAIFQWMDYRKALIIFWSILLLVDVALIIDFLYWSDKTSLSIDNLFTPNYGAISIFVLVSGILSATVSFPLHMSFGYTRKQSYLTTIVTIPIFCTVMAIIQCIIVYSRSWILSALGYNLAPPMPMISIFSIGYFQLAIYVLISFLSFLLGSFFYFYGIVPGILLIAAYITVLNFVSSDNFDFVNYFNSPLELNELWGAHFSLLLSILLAGVGWLIYRKAAVRTY